MGDVAEIAADDARKLRVVLRLGSGDAIEAIDSSGRSYDARLSVDGERVGARLYAAKESPRAPTLRLWLAQAIPKGAKMDFVVEKATELGIARVIPFLSERTIGDASRSGKVERWRRLAKSAAQQCGRTDVPVLDDPMPFAEVCDAFAACDVALVPWELARATALCEVLPSLLRKARSAIVVVGPEGGLSQSEVERAQATGGHAISLGARILRTETAGLVACSAILYASGNL